MKIKNIITKSILLYIAAQTGSYAEESVSTTANVNTASQENDLYVSPTKGKTTLLMMIDSSSSMDDQGGDSDPTRSIHDDYPSCQNRHLQQLDKTKLDEVYNKQKLNDGTEKSTFAYQVPYCQIDLSKPLFVDGALQVDNIAYSRMDRMKIAMSRLLGDSSVASNIVMGLGQFPTHSNQLYSIDITKDPTDPANLPDYRDYFSRYAKSQFFGHIDGNDISAKIILPAADLDGDQRYKERVAVTAMGSGGLAPIASAIAESGAYMLGHNTLNSDGTSPGTPIEQFDSDYGKSGPYYYSGFNDSALSAKSGFEYKSPIDFNNEQCNANGIFLVTNGVPSETPRETAQALMRNALHDQSFTCPTDDGKINAVGTGEHDYGWTCMAKFAQELKKKDIKLSIAGFGNNFVPYFTSGMSTTRDVVDHSNGQTHQRVIYNCGNLQANHTYRYRPYGTSTDQTYIIPTDKLQDVKNACYLGNFSDGYGEGGFYPILSEYHLSTAVKGFIADLDETIPSSAVESPSIPNDTLNPDYPLSYAYFSEFQPDTRASQKVGIWLGNIKKYLAEGGVYYAQNHDALFDDKGEIISTQDYWNANGIDNSNILTGGSLSKLPVQDGRQIYTNTADSSLSLFSTDTLVDSGKAKDKYILNLLGYSVVINDGRTTIENAPALRQMGASLHSPPLFFTTQSEFSENNDYVNRHDFILHGTMQGLVQIVNANTGVEVFSFLPQEIIDTQQNGFIAKSLQTGNDYTHLYQGMDAPWSAYTNYETTVVDNKSIVKASILNVYGGMRRGGSSYYGLDVSDDVGEKITPKFLFKTAVTEHMGQSWSKPAIGKINWKGKPQLVMVVGGGYDPRYDDQNFKPTTDTLGNGVYIFAASDNSETHVKAGDLLWWASNSATDTATSKHEDHLKYSVVSEIKTVDRDADGLIDNLYFGDLGGQVFRVDINNLGSTDENNMSVPHITRLAHFDETNKISPRFYNIPTFTVHDKASLTGVNALRYAVISIGSGDESSPVAFATNGITDKTYGIFDRDIGRFDLYTATDLKGDAVLSDLTKLDENFNATSKIQEKAGWYDELQGDSYALSNANISTQIETHETRYKVLSGFSALKNTLITTYFDGADRGTSKNCSAGIKGRTYLKAYCLPFGKYNADGSSQCSAGSGRAYTSGVGIALGTGIIPISIAESQNGNNTGGASIRPMINSSSPLDLNYSKSPIFKSLDWFEQ